MASHNHSTHKFARGFTLLEILVVMGIFIIVAGFGLFVSFDTYRGYEYRAERDTIVALLQKARAQAVNNMCFGAGCTKGMPHGMHFGVDEYIIFQGASFATRNTSVDEVVPSRYNPVATTGFTDVVFSQLAGTSTPTPAVSTLTVIDTAGSGSSVITVSTQGQITWTK